MAETLTKSHQRSVRFAPLSGAISAVFFTQVVAKAWDRHYLHIVELGLLLPKSAGGHCAPS